MRLIFGILPSELFNKLSNTIKQYSNMKKYQSTVLDCVINNNNLLIDYDIINDKIFFNSVSPENLYNLKLNEFNLYFNLYNLKVSDVDNINILISQHLFFIENSTSLLLIYNKFMPYINMIYYNKNIIDEDYLYKCKLFLKNNLEISIKNNKVNMKYKKTPDLLNEIFMIDPLLADEVAKKSLTESQDIKFLPKLYIKNNTEMLAKEIKNMEVLDFTKLKKIYNKSPELASELIKDYIIEINNISYIYMFENTKFKKFLLDNCYKIIINNDVTSPFIKTKLIFDKPLYISITLEKLIKRYENKLEINKIASKKIVKLLTVSKNTLKFNDSNAVILEDSITLIKKIKVAQDNYDNYQFIYII